MFFGGEKRGVFCLFLLFFGFISFFWVLVITGREGVLFRCWVVCESESLNLVFGGHLLDLKFEGRESVKSSVGFF